ncbi:M3 family oligoendopeptidase [Myxococcota bacterium]|nr:M3 family oligoendopeptidase [Myxococcota bacterium]
MSLPAFPSLHPPEPDLADLATRTATHVATIRAATAPAQVLEAIRTWDAESRTVGTWASWAQIRFAQDTTDPEAAARNDRLDAMGPALDGLSVQVKRAILESPFRDAVAQALGAQALALWALDLQSHDPALEAAQAAEQRLVSRYSRLTGGATIAFRGQELRFPQLAVLRESQDRDTRHEATAATWGWYAAHHDELSTLMGELRALRHEQAVALGDADHVALGYRRMRRRGYGPDDVAVFREEVRRHVLPLVLTLRQAQARRLDVDRLMAWDLPLLDPRGNPRPQGDLDWQVQQGAALFARLGLGDFYAMLRDRELLDLVPRPGKRVGGFCSYIPDAQAPFVFANMNGTAADTRVFTHELGHALQVWSSRDVPLADLQWPTYDAAEVHSMSLELLTWPHMDLFYGEQARRYQRDHLSGALFALPWMAALDEWQHRIYRDPTLDPDQAWRELEPGWFPDLDWGDIAHGRAGRRWQAVPHLFHTPFYMIDYALAQTCALQLWLVARRDPSLAMERYLALCRIGGRAPFLELVEGAGLRSPFQPGVLAEVAQEAAAVLRTLED